MLSVDLVSISLVITSVLVWIITYLFSYNAIEYIVSFLLVIFTLILICVLLIGVNMDKPDTYTKVYDLLYVDGMIEDTYFQTNDSDRSICIVVRNNDDVVSIIAIDDYNIIVSEDNKISRAMVETERKKFGIFYREKSMWTLY